MSRIFYCAFLFLGISALVPLLLAVYVAHATTHPPWYNFEPGIGDGRELRPVSPTSRSFSVAGGKVHDPKTDFDIDYRNISFESTQPAVLTQPVLRGWHIPGKSKEVYGELIGIISVHGGGRDRREFLPHVPFWHLRANLEVVLYDSSEHGISDGTGIGLGFGYREQFDVAGAVRYAKRVLGWNKVIVIGTSVGAASALLGTAREPLVDAVIAENPFYDYEAFFTKIYRDILGVGSFGGRDASRYGSMVSLVAAMTKIVPLDAYIESIATFTRWWIGASGQAAPIDVVHKISPRPLYLIHGHRDEMIPTSHSSFLYEKAGEPKFIWLAPEGQHADVYRFYPEEYEQRILDFINQYVSKQTTAATAA